jgi:hypothetical protein
MQGLIVGTIQRVEPGVVTIGALPLRVIPTLSVAGYAPGMEVIATYQELRGEYWLTGIHRDRRPERRRGHAQAS